MLWRVFAFGAALQVVSGRETSDAHLCGETWGEQVSAFMGATMAPVLARPLNSADPDQAQRVAVLVEPREHPCIGYVVRAVMHYLEDDWALQIYHGRDNLEYIKEELARVYDDAGNAAGTRPDAIARIVFSPLEAVVDEMDERLPFPEWLEKRYHGWRAAMNEHIERTGEWNLLKSELYSQILMQESFWANIVADQILLFQTDSWLCKPGVEQFMDNTYVGAPWRMCNMGEDHQFHHNCLGGNGGMSIRDRSDTIQMIRTQGKNGKRSLIQEDYQYANWLRLAERAGTKYRTLPLNVARDVFSEELMTTHGGAPYGVHKIWFYQTPAAVDRILSTCMADLRDSTGGQAAPVHTEL